MSLSTHHPSPRRLRAPHIPGLLGAAVLLIMGGCSAGELSSGEFSVESHVAQLPAHEGPAMVSVGDLETATELAGLQRPAHSGAEEAPAWLLGLTLETDSGVFVPAPQLLTQSFAQDGGDELGWDLTDVRTFAESARVPHNTILVTGDFDEATLSAELADLGDGVYSAGTGAELQPALAEGTGLRPTGMPLRVAQDAETIMVDAEEQAVRSWVHGEDRPTLADRAEVTALAAALDAQDVYAALIVTETGPLTGDAIPGSEQWAITEPFDVAAGGWSMVDAQPVAFVGYHFADAEAAERAEAQVQTLWADGMMSTGRAIAEMFTVQEVRREGAVVLATLHLGEQGAAQHLHQMLYRQDVVVGYLPQ